ncbi:MAG: VCBS repeat-containing protein [Gemmataceae bacterium]|nr:VCBS repeat-containing protein [Gemmataceae bacterium]
MDVIRKQTRQRSVPTGLVALSATAAGLVLALYTLQAAAPNPPPTFEKRVLTTGYFCDGINAGDINRDGKSDIVAGPYWYEGPDFRRRHEFYRAVPLPPEKSPSDSMFSYVHDFNQDGWPDILVLGRVHLHAAYWYENPRGQTGYWKKHFVFERVRGESPPFVDMDQDGKPELVCHWEGRWGWIKPDWSAPTKPWTFHPITEAGNYDQFYHGTGVGDLNGDGRPDLILNDGWWEQPSPSRLSPIMGERSVAAKVWTAHPFRFARRGGAQMFAYDVDGDGDRDILTSLDAHAWGLAWFEQVREGGRITFQQHTIMGDRSEEKRYGAAFSQPHALALADLDGDGLLDLVVGKRRWAHGPTGDVEPNAEPVVYWFRLTRTQTGEVRFVPHLLDRESGVGVQIVVTDVNGDRAPDVLTASKLGSFLFLNRRGAPAQR